VKDAGINLGGEVNARGLPIYVDGMLITVSGPRRTIVSLDPATGKTLWTFQEPTTGRHEYSMRSNHGKGVAYTRINGRGVVLITVVHNSSVEWTAQEAWQAKTLKSKFSAVVVHDRYAYGLDNGILTCISLVDGTRRWKKGRYGHGQLILVNDMLLIQAESGRIILVKADPHTFNEVATLDALNERTWNHPVVAGRHLLIRSDREAVCYLLPSSLPGIGVRKSLGRR
jgi:outer membrane protein assembly factor BamB